MTVHGEWTRNGASLSHVTAQAEYGVSEDFIIKGIQTGRLEFRDGAIWGNPYLRILRSQLETYIESELGKDYLTKTRNQAELRRVNKEISVLTKQLASLQDRKKELEASLDQ